MLRQEDELYIHNTFLLLGYYLAHCFFSLSDSETRQYYFVYFKSFSLYFFAALPGLHS